MVRFNSLQLQILAPCAAESAEAASAMKTIEVFRGMAQSACARGCKEWGEPEDAARHQAWFRAFEREAQAAIADPRRYAAEQGAGGSASRQSGAAGTDTGTCEAAIVKSDREYEAVNARVLTGAMANLERVMWMTKDRLSLLSANCPNSGRYAAMRQELQQAYDSAAAGCRQIKSGGGECTPDRH